MIENLEELRKNEFDYREKRLENAIMQQLECTNKNLKKLHITYVMTWTGVCGGSKIILEHANKLSLRGHKITIISHFPSPDWFKLNDKVEFIEVPWEKVLGEAIPKCDVIVATYWREIYECIEQKIAPVVYFEQGDFHLFNTEIMDERTRKYITKQFKVAKFIYTVSSHAKDTIFKEYNREDVKVIPNAVDNNIFYSKEKEKNDEINIALIGSMDSEFKRIKNIIAAIDILKNKGYKIKMNWITPTPPKIDVNAIVNPAQAVIGDTLRKSDIYVCASMYESFCLPILEAMSCKTAIVTTNNGGNMDFVRDRVNALLIKKDDIEDMVNKIEILINDEDLRNKLAEAALNTSKNYSWEKTIDKIEEYYLEIAKYEVKE